MLLISRYYWSSFDKITVLASPEVTEGGVGGGRGGG